MKKWDITKENNALDWIDSDPSHISKEEIASKNEVDAKKVKKAVMKRIDGGSKKKKSTKKWVAVLTAAAVSIAVLGTAAAGASGSFNAAFGERFAGEQSYGLYSGGDVTISTDQNVQAALLGISGDDHTVVGMVMITKSDGSDFVDGETDEYFITEYDNNDMFAGSEGLIQYEGQDEFEVSKSLWSRMTGSSEDHSQQIVNYRLADAKHISCEMIYGDDTRNLKGEHLTYRNHTIHLYHIDEVLCQYDSSKDRMNQLTEDIKNNTDKTLQNEQKAIDEAKKTLKENQVINFTSDFSSIVIATKTDITVDLDIHFTLNYRDTDRTLSPVSGEHHSSTSAYLVSEVKASPFSTELTVTADTNGQSFYSVYGMDAFEDMEIKLKNGTVLYGSAYMMNVEENKENEYTFRTNYWKNTRYDFSDWITINPEEIESISFNGEVLAN